ncbi:MAG: biotin-dependent carboxyltransferase family protein [Pseudomonadota bacterium]
MHARLRIKFAGPLVSIQDGGRFGYLRFGVPASGPMDRLSHAAANAALGRDSNQSSIEISMGGLVLECTEGRVTCAVTGGDFGVELAGGKHTSWSIHNLEEGDTLAVKPGEWGSWAYLSFAGDISARQWLNHSATHSTSGFGGGLLTKNQDLLVDNASLLHDRGGNIHRPEFAHTSDRVRVVLGPQDRYFLRESIDQFLGARYTLDAAYDRMGARLKGPALLPENALSIPSEPIVRGSVQVSGDGTPTVLLADHQTTGGYPKIATLISPDVDLFAQLRSGETVGFEAISSKKSVQIVRQYHEDRSQYLDSIASPIGTMEQRLMRNNLISGVIRDAP